MGWTTENLTFRDDYGRHAFIHGINFVDKAPQRFLESGQEPWTEEDLAQAAAWGLTGVRLGVARHSRFIQDAVDEYLWSHTYWCWEPEFAGSEAQRSLVRPHVRAVVGTLTAIQPGTPWTVDWETTPDDIARAGDHAVHEFVLPGDAGAPARIERVPAEVGPGRFTHQP